LFTINYEKSIDAFYVTKNDGNSKPIHDLYIKNVIGVSLQQYRNIAIKSFNGNIVKYNGKLNNFTGRTIFKNIKDAKDTLSWINLVLTTNKLKI